MLLDASADRGTNLQGTTDALAVGDGRYVDISLEVTAQDGMTKKVYTVKVARLPSPVSTLEAVTVASSAGRAAYRVCALEGASCTCRGSVVYGRKGVQTDGTGGDLSLAQLKAYDYKERAVSASTTCTAAVMGGDPLPSVTKHCVCVEQQATNAASGLAQTIWPTIPSTAAAVPAPTPIVSTVPGRQTYEVTVMNEIRSVQATTTLTALVDQDGTLSPGVLARGTLSYGRTQWVPTPSPAPPGVCVCMCTHACFCVLCIIICAS